MVETDGDDGAGAGRGATSSVRLVATDRDDGCNTGGDKVDGCSVDGNKIITANDRGSNRRATVGVSSFSNLVRSRNSISNVNVSPKISLSCERGARMSAQAPDSWNARFRQVNSEETDKIHARHRSRP